VSVPSSRAASLALLVMAGAACRAHPQPSPQFAQASDLYNRLYAKSLDDAYGDPQMAMVVELLTQVDPASSSAPDAHVLRDTVEQGMKEYADREARLRAEVQALEKPARWTGSGHVDLPERSPSVGANGPTLEMTRDDFLSHFGDCFDFRGEYRQGTKSGEAYGVRAGDCEVRYKPFVANLVILLDNRVKALVPLSDVKTVTVDAGPGPAPVAVPPVAAGPKAEPGPTLPRGPLPPGEERVIHTPGAPDPHNEAGPPSVLPW
jgi:hypothetical protein